MEEHISKRLCELVEEINHLSKRITPQRRVSFAQFNEGKTNQLRVMISQGSIRSPEDIVCPAGDWRS